MIFRLLFFWFSESICVLRGPSFLTLPHTIFSILPLLLDLQLKKNGYITFLLAPGVCLTTTPHRLQRHSVSIIAAYIATQTPLRTLVYGVTIKFKNDKVIPFTTWK